MATGTLPLPFIVRQQVHSTEASSFDAPRDPAYSTTLHNRITLVSSGYGSIIVFHQSKLWEANFSILCDVMFLVRLQKKFELDNSWDLFRETSASCNTVWFFFFLTFSRSSRNSFTRKSRTASYSWNGARSFMQRRQCFSCHVTRYNHIVEFPWTSFKQNVSPCNSAFKVHALSFLTRTISQGNPLDQLVPLPRGELPAQVVSDL